MIILGSKVKVLDNTLISLGRCLKVYKKQRYGKVGDTIVLSVLKRKVLKDKSLKVKKKLMINKVYRGLIVMTKKSIMRQVGYQIKYNLNGVILLNVKNNGPMGNRYFGYLSLELRMEGKMKLISLMTKKVFI